MTSQVRGKRARLFSLFRSSETFGFYAEQYLALIQGKSYKTRQLVGYILKDHLLPAFGEKPVSDITNFDLRQYVETKTAVPLKTFNHLKYFKAVIRVARDQNVRVTDFSVQCPDRLSTKSKLYPHQEIARLLNACRPRRLWTMRLAVYIAWTSGLRKTEVLKLPWQYVDLEQGYFRLPADYFKRTKRVSERDIPIYKNVLRILRARRARDKEVLFVFPGRVPGKPQTAIERSWQRMKKKLGIVGTFHSLRGTCATNICQIGVDAEMTCKMMGMTVDVFRRDYLKTPGNVAKFAIENAPKMSREPVGKTISFVRDVISREIKRTG